MKKILPILLITGLSFNSFAESLPNHCDETQISNSAKTMNLSGDVLLTSSDGLTANMTANLVTETSNHEVFKKMTTLALAKNQVILSPIFSIVPAGALVVVQDPKSCKITVFGFDGRALGIHEVVEIKENSLTYLFSGGVRISIARN